MNKNILFKTLLTAGLSLVHHISFGQTNCPSATGVSASPSSICAGSSITLNANLPAGISTINWYTTPTGGTPIATTNTSSTTYTPLAPGTYTYYAEAIGAGGGSATTNFTYTGAPQSILLQAGNYVIETWGANGYTQIAGYNGIGGYATGTLTLTSPQTVYIYVGQGGTYPTTGVSANTWTFNGGGTGHPNNNNLYGHGGGASDVRTIGGSWDDLTSLGSRVIVAGGGGAGRDNRFIGGHGGGNTGGTGSYFTPDQAGGPTGGSQTAGGVNTPWTGLTVATLGKAMTWNGGTLSIAFLAGGGGGYYGGGSGRVAGGGGSSYIGGVTGGSTIMYGQPGFIANPSGNNNGYVRITGQQSCTPGPRVATGTVTVTTAPVFSLGADVIGCENANWSRVLDATAVGATSYQWSNNATSPTITVTQNGTYYVAVSNTQGCTTRDTIIINNQISPSLDLGPNQTICGSDTITLDGTTAGASSYLWNNGAITPTIKAWTAGTYKLTVSSPNGCTATDSVELMVLDYPFIDLGNNVSICIDEDEYYFIDARNPGATYLWDDNYNGQIRAINQSGIYWVKVTNALGCASYDTIQVELKRNPVVNLPNDTTVCEDALVSLFAGNDGIQYYWNTGATSASINTRAAGKYVVVVTANNGCVVEDSTIITQNGKFPLHYGIKTINLGLRTFQFSLVDEENINSYAWDFGDGSPLNYTSNPRHTYAVNGNYIVRILLNSVCGSKTDTSTIHVISESTNIDDIVKESIKIYPNPTKNKVFVDVAIPVILQLYSIDGKLLKTITKTKEIDLNKEAQGMYLLKITDENHNLLRVEKIIKE